MRPSKPLSRLNGLELTEIFINEASEMNSPKSEKQKRPYRDATTGKVVLSRADRRKIERDQLKNAKKK